MDQLLKTAEEILEYRKLLEDIKRGKSNLLAYECQIPKGHT